MHTCIPTPCVVVDHLVLAWVLTAYHGPNVHYIAILLQNKVLIILVPLDPYNTGLSHNTANWNKYNQLWISPTIDFHIRNVKWFRHFVAIFSRWQCICHILYVCTLCKGFALTGGCKRSELSMHCAVQFGSRGLLPRHSVVCIYTSM